MSVAHIYAKALLESTAAASQDDIESELGEVLQAIESSHDLKVVLYGPLANGAEKGQVIDALAQKMGHSHGLANFLKLLARKQRMPLLPKIVLAWGEARMAAQGGVLGEVASADKMNSEDVQGIAAAFSKKLGKKVAFRTRVDQDLIAGIKVTVSGVTYDGSLKSQLQRLRERVTAGLPGTLNGRG